MDDCDLVMADIKHIDPAEHLALTGRGNENILDCLRYLAQREQPLWIRHVLVPGITDDDALLQELRHFLDTLDNIERVDVLPYHTLGIFKYEKLGIPYPLDGVNSPTQERVENAKKILTGK